MLLYGFGHIDPDPAVYDDAVSNIDHWSPSIDLFLKAVPETRLLPTVVSHVVSSKWRNSILYRLRKDLVDRRRLVEFGQVIYQLLFPHRLMSMPLISFGQPATVEELRSESRSGLLLPAVIARAKDLLADHIVWGNTLREQ